MTKRAVDPEWLSGSDGENQPRSRKRTARSRAPRKLRPALYTASVKERAEQATIKINGSTADIDNGILQRIKKCIDRANHPATPEPEARAALHIATRLMKQYNVSQAEVLAHETPDAQRQYAGQSIVALRHADGNKETAVREHNFVSNICYAMEDFFDCKHYSTAKPSSLEFTFYGIAENTVAAAMAFEMSYNLIVEWARSVKGVGPKNSYCLGASYELSTMAKEEKDAEEAEAIKAEADALKAKEKQEKADRQAQLARLAPRADTPVEDSGPKAVTCIEISDDEDTIHSPAQEYDTVLTSSDSQSVRNSDKANAGGVRSSSYNENSPDLFMMASANGDGNDGNDSDGNEYDEWNGFSDSDGSVQGNNDIDDNSMYPDEPVDESGEDDFKADFQVDDEEEHPVAPFEDLDEEIDRLVKAEPRSSDATPDPYAFVPLLPGRSQTSPEPKRESTPDVPVLPNDALSTTAPMEPEPEPEVKWASKMQLITFRETASKIADEYVKEQGVKIYKGTARENKIVDWDAYEKGARDGRKIDVHRKTIKEKATAEQSTGHT